MSPGYIEILSPNFLSRNPLRSWLGLWTHTRYFHPLFRFKAVEPNTSPLSPPRRTFTALDEVSWQPHRSRLTIKLATFVREEQSRRGEKCKLSFFSFFLLELFAGEICRFTGRESIRRGFLVNFFLLSVAVDGVDRFFAISYLPCPYIVWLEVQTVLLSV